MSTDQLSMSMFATRADYDAAARAQAEDKQDSSDVRYVRADADRVTPMPEGLQLAVKLLAKIGDDESDRAIAAVHDLAEAHDQRLTLQHHAWHWLLAAHNAGKRIAELESERNELRAKYDELLVALHGIGAALGIPEGDRSPYSVTCGVLERVNRLAAIEAQAVLDGCGACGDGGTKRGACRLADESPEAAQ